MMQTLSTAKSLTIGGGESNFDMMIFRILSLVLPIIFSSATSAGVVYRVPIQSTIDLGLPPFIERAIGEAEAEGAEAIIFDIDTFGGRVDGATPSLFGPWARAGGRACVCLCVCARV